MRLDLFATSLSNEVLLGTVKRLVSEERKIQSQFLAYLAEVDRRLLCRVHNQFRARETFAWPMFQRGAS